MSNLPTVKKLDQAVVNRIAAGEVMPNTMTINLEKKLIYFLTGNPKTCECVKRTY
jgi:hypothetical protein